MNTLLKESMVNVKALDFQTKLWLLCIIGFSLLLHIFCMISADLLVEEAYYWNYAQHLDFSYLDHPPMVSLLIKCSTLLLGTTEWSVRITGLLCWLVTVFFSYHLTSLMDNRAGLYAVMLLSILPFFFLQTLVITPDLPLLACWSASLYCLYRALVRNESHYWYGAGIGLGLGMLSKYTIVLLGLATLYYLITVPQARPWFKRKEPYACAVIVLLLFTPVIYWNANHRWISFLFQSQRRFASTTAIDLPYLLALVFLFITPLGALDFWKLLKKDISLHSARFMRIFILVPLGFFALFSLNHEINFNWIGPLFLALIPWLSIAITNNSQKIPIWMITALFLLICYSSVLLLATYNTSEKIQKKIFIKAIAWELLIKKFNHLAQQIEIETKKNPIFIPLDNFPIASELSFYQAKLKEEGKISKIYPIVGSHIFGQESLMYRYWSQEKNLRGPPLIFISKEAWRFDLPEVKKQVIAESKLKRIWSHGQGQGIKNIPFYYKIGYL